MSKVSFNLKDDDIPVIEDLCKTDTSIDESIFSAQYKKAISEINDFFNENDAESSNAESYSVFITNNQETHNNIFAFIGDRGSGKTSCMLSLANLLINSKKVVNRNFISLDLIDPTYFDDKNNIIAIIIAKMYRKFTELQDAKRDFSKTQELLKAFEKVQNDFETLFYNNKKESFCDDIENLDSLSSALNLKQDFKDLVEKWLSIFSNESKSCMLLIIDDVDLNTKCADRMLEEIRKYLIQEKVLILISFKLEQISFVKQQQLLSEYKVLLENADKTDVHKKIESMTEAYLTKFIPFNNRIFMPDFVSSLKSQIEIIGSDIPVPDYYNNITLDQFILSLIFHKTRFLFYNSDTNANFIIPHNLREVRQLIKLFWNCKDFDSDDSVNPEYIYNKELFKNHIP